MFAVTVAMAVAVTPVFLATFAVMVMIVAVITVGTVAPTRTAVAGMLLLPAVAHPLLLHEVHRLAARLVAAAIATPVLLMCRWHVQVDGAAFIDHGGRRDDHRLGVHQLRLTIAAIADVDPAVHPGLVDADGHPHVGFRHHGGQGTSGQRQSEQFFHVGLPTVSHVVSTRPSAVSRTGSCPVPA